MTTSEEEIEKVDPLKDENESKSTGYSFSESAEAISAESQPLTAKDLKYMDEMKSLVIKNNGTW